MRRLLVWLLGCFRRLSLAWLRLRGQTPASAAAARVVSGRAWDEFCDTLKGAGAALVFPGAPRDPMSQAEGYRYLTRLLRGGLEAFVEYADPRAPVLHRVVHETVKMGADNPDNHYLTARLDGRLEYRILGRRNTVHYLAFGTQRGHYGQGGGLPPSGFLEGSALELEPDGTFVIHLSRHPQPKNWLPMTEDTGALVVRQTFLDRERERVADLRIELVGEPTVPGQLTPELLEEGLRNASTLVAGASLLFAKWARDFQRHTNTLPRFDPEVSRRAGGDPNIAYYHSHWRLEPEEALLIEFLPPPCEHWNFQLDDYWMESLDYRYFRVHINRHTAHYEPDGSVRLVVAHRDPGLPNWLQTVGHREGTMCLRWVRAAAHPTPQTRVVRLSELTAVTAGAPA